MAGADRALDTGDVDPLVRAVSAAAEQGRSYVAAYVDLAHYAERLLQSATAPTVSRDGAPASAHAEGHAH